MSRLLEHECTGMFFTICQIVISTLLLPSSSPYVHALFHLRLMSLDRFVSRHSRTHALRSKLYFNPGT